MFSRHPLPPTPGYERHHNPNRPGLTPLRIFWSVLAIGLALGLMVTDAAAQNRPAMLQPTTVVVTCDNTARKLSDMITTAASTMKPAAECNGSYKIANPSTTVNACFGNASVDTTITAGGRCYPIGNVSTSAEPVLVVTGSANEAYFKCASSIVLYVACGKWM